MPVVDITPSTEHPVPFDLEDETPENFKDALSAAAAAAEAQVAMGANIDVSEADGEREKALIEEVLKRKKPGGLTVNTAYAAASFLRTYGQTLAIDAVTIRAAITNKLLEIADCGDTKYELRALELLGKHSDIGIFTERSEITVNYKNPEDLEEAIKERIKRLLNADIIDVTPTVFDLDKEFGIIGVPPEEDTTDGAAPDGD